MREVTFIVYGRSESQGSKRNYNGVMVETNKRLKPWRAQVAQVAGKAMRMQDLFFGPVKAEYVFTFQRPASHRGTGRNAQKLKPSAPIFKATVTDLDKICRAIGDSCTGVVFRDDAQIVSIEAVKIWGDRDQAEIRFTELPVA